MRCPLVLALVLAMLVVQPVAAQGRLMGTVVSILDVTTITVHLDGGPIVTVRLIGLGQPETTSPSASAPCFGPEAAARATELLPPGTAVGLEREIQDQDGNGRILAYVWPADGRPMVNEQLIADGSALARVMSPNVKYDETFARAQQAAQAGRLGLWASCVQDPDAEPDGGATGLAGSTISGASRLARFTAVETANASIRAAG
jgi:micrococcal nuclease